MTPRPILLVADPMPEGEFRLDDIMRREGYMVIRCPASCLNSLKVLAPAPFTAGDVAALRALEAGSVVSENGSAEILASLADRIEATL